MPAPQLSWDAEACRHIQDALLSRLETKSSNVKLKGLRLLKILVEKGSPNIKRDVQRRVHVIRDCLHWRCDPHPTMGELPAKMVRQAAQETINSILDTTAPSAAPPPPPASAAPAQSSYTPTPAASAPALAPAIDKSRYGGFGRDSFQGGGGGAPERSILSYASGHSGSGGMSSSPGGHGMMQGFGNIPNAAMSMPATPQQGVEMAMKAGVQAASALT